MCVFFFNKHKTIYDSIFKGRAPLVLHLLGEALLRLEPTVSLMIPSLMIPSLNIFIIINHFPSNNFKHWFCIKPYIYDDHCKTLSYF